MQSWIERVRRAAQWTLETEVCTHRFRPRSPAGTVACCAACRTMLRCAGGLVKQKGLVGAAPDLADSELKHWLPPGVLAAPSMFTHFPANASRLDIPAPHCCCWFLALQHKCITSYICVYFAPPHKPRGCRVSAQSKAVHAALQTSFLAPDGSLMVQRLSRLLRNHLQQTSKAAWEFGTAGLRQLGCARAFSSAAPAPVESQANLGFVDGGYKVTDFPQDKARLRGPRKSCALACVMQLPWKCRRALKLWDLCRFATSPS